MLQPTYRISHRVAFVDRREAMIFWNKSCLSLTCLRLNKQKIKRQDTVFVVSRADEAHDEAHQSR